MTLDGIKITQKVSLGLLKAFAEICDRYNLRYYIGGGTMLGAVRHKGFIPWDDDADIDMPRKDYDRFLAIADEALKDYPGYEIENFHRNNLISMSIRLVDNSKRIIYGKGTVLERITGIWLDIVPVDGIPDGPLSRKIHLLRLSVLKECYHFSVLKYGGITPNNMKVEKRPLIKRIGVFLGTHLPVEKIFDYNVWIPKYEKALKKYSFYNCKMAGTLITVHGKKSIFPVEWYGKGTKYPFEDIEVIGVDNYDAWLTQLYGDYMTLPDEKHRVSHNFEIIDEDQPV